MVNLRNLTENLRKKHRRLSEDYAGILRKNHRRLSERENRGGNV